MATEISEIIVAFCGNADSPVRSLGKGNINETYLVDADSQPFVLQKISKAVFPDPVVVIENFEVIHNHLAGKDKTEANSFVMAAPIYTKDGVVCCVDRLGGCWRAQSYVDTRVVDGADSQKRAQSVGATLAKFHNLFHDLHLGKLKEPLPGFHHLFLYLESYHKNSAHHVKDYGKSLLYCHSIVDSYRDKACTLEVARQRGELTHQPTHGDPKLDNFIFDSKGQATGLLDLDTVGAGLVYHDLGDCLRSICSLSGESVADTRPPGFDLQHAEWIVEGYLSEGVSDGSAVQSERIYDGLVAICFELGLRFFTDHLQGNIYFRVQKDGENLLKARKQFQLLENIVEQESVLKKCFELLCKKS